jgi:hypothetical protein
MRARTVLAVTAVAILAAAGCGKAKKAKTAAPPPPPIPGSYALTCRNIAILPGGYLSADCADAQGRYSLSYLRAGLCKGDISNMNGLLTCAGATGSNLAPGAEAPPAASDAPASDAPLRR